MHEDVPMMSDMDGKNVIVTGASRGLGRAIAERFLSLGANVVLTSRNPDKLAETSEALNDLGGSVSAVPCDLSNGEDVRRAAAEIADRMPRIDVLVNNAGIPAPRTFGSTTFEDWDEVIGVNLGGGFYMTRALWPSLIGAEHSYVINISGIAGLRGGESPAYGSSKAGLAGLTHAIALSGKEHNLRATVLYLGSMDTGWRGTPIGEKPSTETMDPREVARFVAYLVNTPHEFVVNEAVVNPIAHPWS